jgi:hypothetical protein
MSITAKNFARACHQLAPVVEQTDIETQEALARLCDPATKIRREDALALGVAFLLQLQEKKGRSRAARR